MRSRTMFVGIHRRMKMRVRMLSPQRRRMIRLLITRSTPSRRQHVLSAHKDSPEGPAELRNLPHLQAYAGAGLDGRAWTGPS